MAERVTEVTSARARQELALSGPELPPGEGCTTCKSRRKTACSPRFLWLGGAFEEAPPVRVRIEALRSLHRFFEHLGAAVVVGAEHAPCAVTALNLAHGNSQHPAIRIKCIRPNVTLEAATLGG
jgi:hypothetical protein